MILISIVAAHTPMTMQPPFPLGAAVSALRKAGYKLKRTRAGAFRMTPYRSRFGQVRWAELGIAGGRVGEVRVFAEGLARCSSLEAATRREYGPPQQDDANAEHFYLSWRVPSRSLSATFIGYDTKDPYHACWITERLLGKTNSLNNSIKTDNMHLGFYPKVKYINYFGDHPYIEVDVSRDLQFANVGQLTRQVVFQGRYETIQG